MSSTTSLTPLPYPNPTDQPFVHLDIKALAEATTESLYVASEAAPAHKAGRRWYKPSTKVTSLSDGAAWHALPYAEWIGSAVCIANGSFTAAIPAGIFTTNPIVYATVQTNTQFAFACAVATSTTAISGYAGFFPGGVGNPLGATAGFTVVLRAVQIAG